MLAGVMQMAAVSITSPDGNFVLRVELTPSGAPYYTLDYKNKPVVEASALGLKSDQTDLTDGFRIAGTDTITVDRTWEPVWGEYSTIRDNFKEMAVNLVDEDRQREMTIRFRLFNDGLGFRYELPVQKGPNHLTVKDELTEFNFTGNHKLYCIPGDYDTDEYLWSETTFTDLPEALESYGKHSEAQRVEGLTIQTPMLLKTDDGVYINVHEAALDGYPAMLLDVDPETYTMKSHLVPDRLGVSAYLELPFSTPWRTLIVSDDARDILSSQLVLNLNEPCKIEDTSWIKPMKFMGVWWEMFTGYQKTWAYSDDPLAKPGVTDYTKLTPNGRHPANTENVKRYIDFAAKHGIDGVLVEGWNEGWEDWAGYRKNRQFLFDKPYPDFNVEELRDYAKEKGVKLIMHHETAANAADYELQLDRAFQFMKDNNYDAVKTGYVGAIIPRSEHHTSQWMVDHARNVIERAADYQIMVDSHEAPRPTGLCRTYPNWLAQESARGGEFESMGGNPPSHTCILPFTRLKGGPMDYTPGLFETKMSYYGEGKDSQAGTTLARQLALYLTMPSPMQMACDLPENYERFPDAFQFIKDVPVDWADSKYLEAEPNRYITVARLDKNSDDWYVGAITDENGRTAEIDLSFLPAGEKYVATIYEDAPDAHWKDNPQAYRIRTVKVKPGTKLKQNLAPGGGAAIRISKEPK
ncbi:glycoside hydrolase family 97 protein [Duncaniella sp.]|uniref:glycoside hydrolase family 97 protein n=1 Tax=Duncaniella sp. TaxID=2518496 RepID=UPI00260A45D4|nr:glycoside hydrolase family 97 protein [Duncaniella sp.]